MVGSSVGGSLSFLVFLPPFCASSLSTLNWPLGPATLYLSSKGSLILGQTYHPSPSDLSLTGYFTAQASFFRRPFSHLPHPGLLTALSFWLRFLGRLFRRPLFAARLHTTGYLGGRIALLPPCCTPVFLPLWSGTGFLGALLFRRPPGCHQPTFARFLAQPVVPARQWRLPWVAFLTLFSFHLFDRSRGVGPLFDRSYRRLPFS